MFRFKLTLSLILRGIFFMVFLFSVSLLYAQTDFRQGYVITNSNDTLYGEIDYRGDMLMGQICKFRTNENDIVEYTPYDIAAYRFYDDKYFVSKEIEGKKVFLEFLIKGQANIYYLRDDIGNHYFIDKEYMPLSEIPYEKGIREIDGKKYSYSTETHWGILYHYMQDASDIQAQIKKVGQPEHKNLIKLAEDYHYAVCTDGSSCIVFEKKQPFTKVAVDVVGGMAHYLTYLTGSSSASFTGGVLLNFWMPRANEKIYFRTGLLYSNLLYPNIEYTNEYRYYEERLSLYKIPLMLEYIYPKSVVIKPKISYGPTYYLGVHRKTIIESTSCMGAGFNIQLDNSMIFSLEYNVDFATVAYLIPKRVFSHSLLAGFNFRF